MTAEVRYPANEVTPQGWYMLTKGDYPSVWLEAYDGSVEAHLMGGHSLPDRYAAPECMQIKRGGLKDLIPPWKHIDQKGATEDGVTNLDTLYDPAEPKIEVRCYGRDGRHVQRVARHLIASIDAKQQSTLHFVTHDEGHWWGKPRWFQGAPPNPVMGGQNKFQDLSLRLRIDGAFYRSYDDTSHFRFVYDSMVEEFTYTDTGDMGANWPTHFYEGAGAGFPRTNGSAAFWSTSGTGTRGAVIGPYAGFDTDTDNQVIEIELGAIPGTYYADGPFNDIWGRMGSTGSAWDGNGIRARVGRNSFYGWVELSRYNNFVKTVLFSRRIGFRPHRGDKFRLVCGDAANPRMFKVFRNGVPVLAHKETGTGSLLGAAYRGIGFGMLAAAGTAQKAPAWITKITAGDNATITQSSFFQCTNVGDQDCYYDYTAFGPFTKLKIYDGPGSSDFIEFGPLTANQAALLRTDPRDRNVYDLATVPAVPSPQEKSIFDAAFDGLLSFITLGGSNPILQVVQSIFGIFGGGSAPALPQGNMYALLKGRFSDHSAIPAKSPGNPAQTQFVKVEVVGGNADTLVICSGVPLRRWPL
jgi:hypothetical protein